MVFTILLFLWMPIQSLSGFFFMVAKSDVFNIFHQFQSLIKRQFSLKIKYVQTNWGGEY